MTIDTGHYRRALLDAPCEGGCKVLKDALVDTVRALLQHQYPFLRWSVGGDAPPDTVEIRLANRHPDDLPRSDLRFRILGAVRRMQVDSVSVKFEEYEDITGRDPEDWSPESLRRSWLARFPEALRGPDLLPEVFGRIPLNAPITFAPNLVATVGVTPAELSGGQNLRPVFLVLARVVDPGTNSDESAELDLKGCKTAPGQAAFSCRLTQLRYPTDTIVDSIALAGLIRRATLSPQRVLVRALPKGSSAVLDQLMSGRSQ